MHNSQIFIDDLQTVMVSSLGCNLEIASAAALKAVSKNRWVFLVIPVRTLCLRVCRAV